MILQISIETLLTEFLTQHDYDNALIVPGPISVEERAYICKVLDIPTFRANGDYNIFTKIPVGALNIRGWLWENRALVEIT